MFDLLQAKFSVIEGDSGFLKVLESSCVSTVGDGQIEDLLVFVGGETSTPKKDLQGWITDVNPLEASEENCSLHSVKSAVKEEVLRIFNNPRTGVAVLDGGDS